jgi:hypothetical protein
MNLSGTLNITPKLLEVKRKRYESFKLLTDALERCETNSIQFGEILNVLNNKQHGLFSTLDSVYELQDEIRVINEAQALLISKVGTHVK